MIVQSPTSDPLSDVLSLSGLSAACSIRLLAGGQWALRFRPIELKFNVLRRGECWLQLENMLPRHLRSGDCFVVSGAPFVLSSDPEVEAVNASDLFAQSDSLATLGVEHDVELLGGSIELHSVGARELRALLPPAIIIHANTTGASSFAWLLDELDREWQSARPGAYSMCNDLLRLIFVHTLRHHINHADVADLAWLGGLRHAAIADVMRAVHSAPAKNWKLAELADIACMSRSSFAVLFKARTGQSPVEYATRWRMQIAAARLRASDDSVASIAESLGYLSDAAFGAAFRRVHLKSPGQYRRESLS